MSFEIGVSIQWISTTSAIRFVFAECIVMSMYENPERYIFLILLDSVLQSYFR